MIAASVLILFFAPWGNDLYALPKMAAVTLALAFARPSTTVPQNWRPFAAMAAAVFFSTVYSQDLGLSLFSIAHARGLGLFEWVVCGLLFLHGMEGPQWEIETTIATASLIMAGYAIAQGCGIEFPFLIQHVTDPARATSTQGSPIMLGEVLVVAFPFAWRHRRWMVWPFVVAACAARCRSACLALGLEWAYLQWRSR